MAAGQLVSRCPSVVSGKLAQERKTGTRANASKNIPDRRQPCSHQQHQRNRGDCSMNSCIVEIQSCESFYDASTARSLLTLPHGAGWWRKQLITSEANQSSTHAPKSAAAHNLQIALPAAHQISIQRSATGLDGATSVMVSSYLETTISKAVGFRL